MDPVSALAAATTAFNVIKKGFEIGKDIESMYSDMGRWMGAISDIDNAVKETKNPPLFKKIVSSKSVEQEAIEAFAAKKKAQQMTDDLRDFICYHYGMASWDEIIKMQGQIRRQRQEIIYNQRARQQKFFEVLFICLAMTIGLGIVIWIVYLIVSG